ncbi:hypothetical protein L873DRAFT_1819646 [Choiromyces venosus 120613-1]|uniref:Increased loss of mitochondrial DNA protein 1 n=1 Tax=Choiromyces venosus 120613-1 TaxID=1336337 RepID=A0A3N4IYT0_9PEZI|nr:hypothetical protein L873DRAFT_1819646 [Choiromyces venosus 120613-1]
MYIAAHLTLGYLLITNPRIIAEQDFIFIMGESLGLPHPKSTFHLNPLATSLLGLTLILHALSDLAAVSGSNEEVSRGYWDAQAPIRLSFFFFLTGYVWLYRGARGTVTTHPVKNSLVFCWGFVEIMWLFWVYTQLREEKRGAQVRIAMRKRELRRVERRAMGIVDDDEDEE